MSLNDPILEDVVMAIESWFQRILKVEIKIDEINKFAESIDNQIKCQVIGGLTSTQESSELSCIVSNWKNIYRVLLCRDIGCEFQNWDILSNLLELFSLKQISKDFFIWMTLEICQETQGQSKNMSKMC